MAAEPSLPELLEAQRAQREALTEACVVADAEDGVAQARCAAILDDFAGSVQRLAARAAELAAVTREGGPRADVVAATSAVDAARADVMRAQLRVVDEWTEITRARLDRAQELSQQVSRVCASTSALTTPD
ncbi:hypothetical protein [Cryptosporangium minutisporangium]|uniref:Uncharacterized protein n=1 Tax=Cryptosporangium minutisporangium TaxID=113569 RepID=A0ABP6SPI9_9ACTN